MTANEFKAWRARMGWSIIRAADELGIGVRTCQNYNDGQKPVGDGRHRKTVIPHPIYLATKWLEEQSRNT